MKYSSRIFLYGPVGAFALLIAGICLHWFWAADALSKKIDALNGQQVMPGVTLRFTSKEMAGFPFRLDATFRNLDITVETKNGLARWKTEDFAFHTLTYGRAQEVFEAAGKQTITWTGEKGDAKSFEFIPGSLRASAIEDAGGLTRFDLDLVDLGSTPLQAGRVQFHIRKEADVLQFVVSTDVALLSQKLASAFGDTIKTLRLDGSISQAGAFDDLRGGKADWRAALDGWRTHGGAVQLNPSEIAWAKIKLGASGALTLDEQNRPKGLLSLKVSNLAALSEEAAKRGVLKGANAGLAAGLLETQKEALSLAFKDGMAYVEQTPVAALTPLY